MLTANVENTSTNIIDMTNAVPLCLRQNNLFIGAILFPPSGKHTTYFDGYNFKNINLPPKV